jgi:hypothetical protein
MSLPYFRINMAFSYSPSTPPTPTNPDGTAWVDVANWQSFLKVHGEGQYLGPAYPTDNFDNNTKMATIDWQNKNGLIATGIVNQATYDKAVSEGMPAYPTVVA